MSFLFLQADRYVTWDNDGNIRNRRYKQPGQNTKNQKGKTQAADHQQHQQRLYTSIFCCPVTDDVFFAGNNTSSMKHRKDTIISDGARHYEKQDGGLYWYSTKMRAEHACASEALSYYLQQHMNTNTNNTRGGDEEGENDETICNRSGNTKMKKSTTEMVIDEDAMIITKEGEDEESIRRKSKRTRTHYSPHWFSECLQTYHTKLQQQQNNDDISKKSWGEFLSMSKEDRAEWNKQQQQQKNNNGTHNNLSLLQQIILDAAVAKIKKMTAMMMMMPTPPTVDDKIQQVLICAEKCLFTDSIVVENKERDESNFIVDNNTNTNNNNTPEIVAKEVVDDDENKDPNKQKQLIVKIVSGCDLSNYDDPESKYKKEDIHTMTMTCSIKVKPLLVLDLNGILCHRDRKHKRVNFWNSLHGTQQQQQQQQELIGNNSNNNNIRITSDPPAWKFRLSIGNVANSNIIPRTDLIQFLQYLDQHFCLAIWTSAKTKTANRLLKLLLGGKGNNNNNNNNCSSLRKRFLFIWSQTQCTAITRPASSSSSSREEEKMTAMANNHNNNDDNNNNNNNRENCKTTNRISAEAEAFVDAAFAIVKDPETILTQSNDNSINAKNDNTHRNSNGKINLDSNRVGDNAAAAAFVDAAFSDSKITTTSRNASDVITSSRSSNENIDLHNHLIGDHKNNNISKKKKSYDDNTIYQKNIHKIFQNFPLWSNNNTLLMDDSAEKCPFFVANAIHPPPLHGRNPPPVDPHQSSRKTPSWSSSSSSIGVPADQENEDQQAVFFRELVSFWTKNVYVEEVSATVTTKLCQEENKKEDNSKVEVNIDGTTQSSSSSSSEDRMSNTKYYEFLQSHARGHMGWRESKTSFIKKT